MSTKAAGHLNKILLSILLRSLKPTGNLNKILSSSLLCSFNSPINLSEIKLHHKFIVRCDHGKPEPNLIIKELEGTGAIWNRNWLLMALLAIW